MTKDRSDELRKTKLKEYAGIAYEAGALIFDLFGSWENLYVQVLAIASTKIE